MYHQKIFQLSHRNSGFQSESIEIKSRIKSQKQQSKKLTQLQSTTLAVSNFYWNSPTIYKKILFSKSSVDTEKKCTVRRMR